jgi:leucyl/phenylalanyl-tRNA---protein transferase
MNIMALPSNLPSFPPPESADATGLVVVTDTMTPEMLLAAYSAGIFPWTDNPVRWYSPDPRAVFLRGHVRLPSNLPKLARKARFRVTFDTAFTQTMEGCADAHAHDGEWISPRFIDTYSALHAMGFAHSVEVWQEDELVGGLYGVQVGHLFAGESMFYTVPNASKVAFASLWDQLAERNIPVVDAQVLNENTHALGAVQFPRADYLRLLRERLIVPSKFDGQHW